MDGEGLDGKKNRWLVLVLLALLTAGCQARLGMHVDVDADGSGTLAVSLSADEPLLARAEKAGVDPLGDLVAVGRDLSSGWKVRDDHDESGGRTVRLDVAFESPAELEALAGDLAAGLSAPEVKLLESLRVELTDDELRFSATAALDPTDAVTELGVQPAQAVTILEDTEALVYELSVRLAGKVTQANADEGFEPDAVDQLLTWRVEPGERVEARAVSLRPRLPWLLVAGAVVGGVLVLGVVVLLVLSAGRRLRA